MITTTIHLDAGSIELNAAPNGGVKLSATRYAFASSDTTAVTMTRAQTRELRNQLLAMMWPADELISAKLDAHELVNGETSYQ